LWHKPCYIESAGELIGIVVQGNQMAISFEKALGIHEQALMLRGKRTQVLANNLVNADTPNFKARDFDFKTVMQSQVAATGANSAMMRSTHSRHIAQMGTVSNPQLMYRTPLQPSLDGNTVDEQVEMSRFAKNSMDFQASFQFLNGRFKGLKNAIRGEV
jgi:flagellar basal-body rod protein FlgB